MTCLRHLPSVTTRPGRTLTLRCCPLTTRRARAQTSTATASSPAAPRSGLTIGDPHRGPGNRPRPPQAQAGSLEAIQRLHLSNYLSICYGCPMAQPKPLSTARFMRSPTPAGARSSPGSSRGPASVSELAAPLAMSLPAVVQHIDVLQKSGLVSSEKVGRVRTCRLEPDADAVRSSAGSASTARLGNAAGPAGRCTGSHLRRSR